MGMEQTYMPTAMVAVEGEDVTASGLRAATGFKQGHRCCGCCCDTRRAVITVNSIMAILLLLGTVLGAVGIELLEIAAADADDDEVKEAGEELQQTPLGLLVFMNICLIGCFVAGILGAVNYNPTLVKLAAGAYVAKIIIDIIGMNLVALIIDGFFLYPHIFFLKEMRDNIMTHENYPNEAQCCC